MLSKGIKDGIGKLVLERPIQHFSLTLWVKV